MNLLLKELFQPFFGNKQSYYKGYLLIPEYKLKELFVQENEQSLKKQSQQIKKSIFNSRSSASLSQSLNQGAQQEAPVARQQESKISKRMLYLTNKRINMVMIILLIIIPLLSAYFWFDIGMSYLYELRNLLLIRYGTNGLSLTNYYIQNTMQ